MLTIYTTSCKFYLISAVCKQVFTYNLHARQEVGAVSYLFKTCLYHNKCSEYGGICTVLLIKQVYVMQEGIISHAQ